MKPKKKKLDIKAFFINHVEKVILALVIPLALFFAWKGTKFTLLQWTPVELEGIAKDADQKIKGSERGPADEGISVSKYDLKAQLIKVPILPDLYATDIKWMPSLFPEKNKRTAVDVFTVEDLRASSGLGAMLVDSTRPEASRLGVPPGTTQIGQRWAVVTGLIPYAKQSEHFIRTFSESVFTEELRDTPQYRMYDVFRAEIPHDTNIHNLDPDDLDWIKLDISEALKKTVIWGRSGSGRGSGSVDPVDVTYQAPIPRELSIPMAQGLPPVTKPFGAEVAHPPMIPVLTDEQAQAIQEQKQLQEEQLTQFFEIDLENIITRDPFAQPPEESGGVPLQKSSSQYFLFRFFDFSVESGHTYCYRVQLRLNNPNHGLKEELLENRSLQEAPLLVTDFSEPSNPVTIPLGSRVLVSSTSLNEQSPWLEPQAGIFLIYFDMENGTEWYHERDRVYRGQTLNFRGDGIGPPKTEGPDGRTGGGGIAMGATPAPQGTRNTSPRGSTGATTSTAASTENKRQGMDFHSEICVLDIYGGTRFPRASTQNIVTGPDLRAPGRVLVLEPGGQMRLRKIDTDAIEMEQLKNPITSGTSGLGTGGLDGMGSPSTGSSGGRR